MTRDAVNDILSEMERLRLDSYEAETDAEERRLMREYGRLARIIEPYVSGKRPHSTDGGPAHER